MADQIQNQQHHLEALERSTATSDVVRKAAFDCLESKMQDELSFMGTALEAKVQETTRMVKFCVEQMEMRLRDDVGHLAKENDIKIEKTRNELFVALDDKEEAPRVIIGGAHEPARVIGPVAPAPDVAHATQAPVIDLEAPAPAVGHATPDPMIDLVAPAPAVAHATPARVIEPVAPAPAIARATPAPVIDLVALAPAVVSETPARVIEPVALAPAVAHATPAPVIARAHNYSDEGKSPKRAKKSSWRNRPHHHDDDDLLLSEATALADYERTLMREEMRTRLAAQLCPLSHPMFLSDRPEQCRHCVQSAEELACCPT